MTDDQHHREREQDDARWRWVFGLLLTVALFLAGYGITALMWAGSINARMDRMERDGLDREARVRVLEGDSRELTQQLRNLTDSTVEIKGTLQRLDQEVRALPQAIYRAINGDSP